MDGCMSVLFLLSLLFVGLTAERRFIDFQPGYEYVYSFSGYTDVKELGKFLVNAKVPPLSLSLSLSPVEWAFLKTYKTQCIHVNIHRKATGTTKPLIALK